MSYQHLVTHVISHKAAVCSLYKRVVRSLQASIRERDIFRMEAVRMRAKFDANKNIVDSRVAKELLDAGEKELFKYQHWQPIKFPESPGGVAYERVAKTPDWVLDAWHPLEKAQYPKYFATREKRKLEFIEMCEKTIKELKLGANVQKSDH
ncbi:NADH:ubiquinone dehydrogenase-like [Tropilaelaps mercedesae]|uniref:NADH dehydrogenase [ubiquinone] 1 beta subcomplex subunit 9 n=1 Tax=Tropilaelaps mercedesae TaxID=418985 RepID=A0A1V9WZ15_9ACAR|nr:NADH:ubiquinone dehydrogenase-like [Tropilaelaps mercedesae]